MHNIVLVFAMLFSLGLISSIVGNDVANATVQLTIIIILLWYYFFFRSIYTRTKIMIRWLAENYKQLENDQLLFNGIPIDRDTEFIRFEVCFSIAILSFRYKTGYFIRDQENTSLYQSLCICFSILFGWWALPMGPVNTIKAIVNSGEAKPVKYKQLLIEFLTEEKEKK